jgi:triacylglycerol lipase
MRRHHCKGMRPFVLLTLALAAGFAAASCTAATDAKNDRCAKLNTELANCVGASDAPLDCSKVSDADVERLQAATGSGACSFIAGALPLDGDPKGASCRLLNVGCVNATNPAPADGVPATKYPIVLVNGIDTSPLFRYSDRIVSGLKKAGFDVHLATLTPYEPPRVRAPELHTRIEEIRQATGAEKVNLVCHSLGGLDCRYLVSPGGAHWELKVDASKIAASVASITTVGTAHRGTRVADDLLAAPTANQSEAITAFATLAGDWFSSSAIDRDVHLRDALTALSEANAPAFNDEIIDAQGIYYQSFAGVSLPRGQSSAAIDLNVIEECGAPIDRHDWMALPLVPFVNTLGKETPSDGLTTVRSAKWGNFRGCIPVDHMEQLGQRNLPDANVQNGFDIARFYAGIAADLAERGF